MQMKSVVITKRLAAIAMAATCVLGSAGIAAMANAAYASDDTSITLNAPEGQTLKGHRFTAYQLGKYTGSLLVEGDPSSSYYLKSLNVSNVDDATAKWLAAAGVAKTDTLDEAGTLAKWTNKDNAAKIREVANKLAASEVKPAESGHVDGDGASAVLHVKEQGLYLVTDSAGKAIIVGTTLEGASFKAQPLGIATVKTVTATAVTKSGSSTDTTAGVGRAQYTVTFKLPEKDDDAKTVEYIDSSTGLEIDAGTIRYSVNGGAETKATVTESDYKTGFTWDASTLLTDENYGKTVTLKYEAAITGTDPVNNGRTRVLYKDGKSMDTPANSSKLNNFNFSIRKTGYNNADQGLYGAYFTIQRVDGDNPGYLSLDLNSATKWTVSDKPAPLTTDDKGSLVFEGLGDGTYRIVETAVPFNYMNERRASFTVTISDNGTHASVSLEKGDRAELVTPTAPLTEDGRTGTNEPVRVKNVEVSNIAKNDVDHVLAETGGPGIVITVTMAAVAALGAATSYSLKRRLAD